VRGEPAARRDPGHRTDRRHRPRRRDRRLEGVRLRSQPGGLDWVGTEAELDRGKDRLGSITKQGNRYLRWLLVAGSMAVIRYA